MIFPVYKIQLQPDKTLGSILSFLEHLDVLVICIPPLYTQGSDFLYKGLQTLFNTKDFTHIQQLIYISSTGVFHAGQQSEYDEDTPPNNTTDYGKCLTQLENYIQGIELFQKLSIIRFGGLIKHKGRHPVHHLAGRTQLPNPDAPVNLIEQTDAVGLILSLIKHEKPKPIYHGVYPWHPTRKAYYTETAKRLGLKSPQFSSSKTSLGKLIKSEKTSKDLNYQYRSKI